jgi:2-keto-4-pentenoate hydratase/2-oxohepta-3-ene-1,7-dioic acid hydratase in catechol pathway
MRKSTPFSAFTLFSVYLGKRSLLEKQLRDHVTELNNQRPKQPFFFLKPASSILPPGAGPVIRPKGVDLHYEVELALILGKQVKNLEASDEKTAFDSIESTTAHHQLLNGRC